MKVKVTSVETVATIAPSLEIGSLVTLYTVVVTNADYRIIDDLGGSICQLKVDI